MEELLIKMNPILKYRGGKLRELDHYMKYIPSFNKYYEPFFGGGATYFNLEPSNARIGDINASLVRFYQDFVNNFDRVKLELHDLQLEYEQNRLQFLKNKKSDPNHHVIDPNDALYYRIRDMFNKKIDSPFSYATLYFFINKTAYSGMIRYNKSGEFNVPYGRYANFNTDLLTVNHYNLLSTAEIENESYENSFEEAGSGDFIYLDPPYDTTFSDYGNEEFTGDFNEDSHRKLAQDFKNLEAPALMIISKTRLTSELYSGYIKDAYEKKYSVNIRNRFKSQAEHLVITNYRVSH